MCLYLSGMRHGYRNFIGLLVLAFIAGLTGCQKDIIDERELIQQRLQAMALAVEERRHVRFLAGIHKMFLGQGALRKSNLAGVLLLHSRKHQSISIRLSNIKIQLDGEHKATATLEAHLSGQGGWLSQGRELRIQSRWQKFDGEWLIERARWKTVN